MINSDEDPEMDKMLNDEFERMMELQKTIQPGGPPSILLEEQGQSPAHDVEVETTPELASPNLAPPSQYEKTPSPPAKKRQKLPHSKTIPTHT